MPKNEREREKTVERLQAEHDRLEKRTDALYTDKVDGEISSDYYKKMSAQWREEMALCAERIAQSRQASRRHMEEGCRVFEYAISAQERFEKAEGAKKRNLLKTLLSNSKFYDGKVIAKFHKPLDLLEETSIAVAKIKEAKAPNKAVFARWRREWDSNPRTA